MYIANKEELVPILRSRLRDYLVLQDVCDNSQRKFKCFVHSDSDPSMQFDSKRGDEVVHCFACGADLDIFGAAEHLEGLPQSGPDWVTRTIPELATRFGIPVVAGTPSPQEAEKIQLFRIAQDIADILESPEFTTAPYATKRNWINPDINFGTIQEDTLMAKLVERGHAASEIRNSMIVSAGHSRWFGKDLVTTVVRDFRGRPCGFVSRNIGDQGPKYINSCESPIFQKGNLLLGFDTALKPAKHNGLIIVEGPGDLAQLRRCGIRNSVAVAGTAFTPDHLLQIKSLGIRNIYFCLDWDTAGQEAVGRVFNETLRHGQGVNCYVIAGPVDESATDPDELLAPLDQHEGYEAFKALEVKTAFEWTIDRLPEDFQPADICVKMIPIIAAEPLAVRRDVLIQIVSNKTGIHSQSILTDVTNLRDNKFQERKDRLRAAGQKYLRALERDPDAAASLLGEHEDAIRDIEKEYQRDIIGPNYQIAKFEAVEEAKKPDEDGNTKTRFTFKFFKDFAKALSDGGQYTTGTVMYFPGRQNSGKTATMIALGVDVLLNDPDTIVLFHFTDDDYQTVQPRIKTNIAMMTKLEHEPDLTVGEANDPYGSITSSEKWGLYKRVDETMRNLIGEGKLVIIDGEEGDTLAALERQLAYLRRKHPESKILCVCDNTHNYNLGADSTAEGVQKYTKIANIQKSLTRKYKCCMFASAEYRKNESKKPEELRLPVDDDILGAGAFAYRANLIVHVYNDLNDRKDFAEAYWLSPANPDVPQPRLQLIFSKNKITSFKRQLAMDLDTSTVTVFPTDLEKAKHDTRCHVEGRYRIQNGLLYTEAEDYDEVGEDYD
jgi:DNA primase catalytic core